MAPQTDGVRTAIDMWRGRVEASGDKVAFRFKREGAWQTMTWRQADEVAREIAAGLASIGVRRGDAVCLISQTRIDWVLADIAILLTGGVTVPVYPSNTAEQCAFIVKDCGARVVIAEDAAQIEKVAPLLDGMPSLRLVHIDRDAALEKTDARGRTVVKLDDVLASRRFAQAPVAWANLRDAGRGWMAKNAGELERRASVLGPQDTFTIIYTSGTTGNPKGVVLSHENLVSAVMSACRALALDPDDEQFLFLPLAHVLGREMAWVPIHMGVVTAFAEGLTKIKDNLVDIRPTFMAGVPRIFEKFYNAVLVGSKQGSPIKVKLVAWAFGVGARSAAAKRKGSAGGAVSLRLADKLVLSKLRAKLGLDRCRFLISGGAPLAAEIAEFFEGVGLLILEGYGLTETMAAAFVNREDRHRFGTVGPAIDVVESKIAADGEILMRGPSVFKRYHNDPVATAEAIDADGWFHSGDIGVLEDGFLRITDRKKDLIVTAGGKKIAPQMLENALKTRCNLISQVMVYGDKRPYCVALVTLSEDAIQRFGAGDSAKAATNPEALAAVQRDIDALNRTLAGYESIKKFSILPSDFTETSGEMTPSMKVKRKVVIDRYRQTIDAMYGDESTVDSRRSTAV